MYRAVDEASTLKQPSLHMSAAAASRDITLFHAMDLLHACRYDFARGALALVDHGAPRYAHRLGWATNAVDYQRTPKTSPHPLPLPS